MVALVPVTGRCHEISRQLQPQGAQAFVQAPLDFIDPLGVPEALVEKPDRRLERFVQLAN